MNLNQLALPFIWFCLPPVYYEPLSKVSFRSSYQYHDNGGLDTFSKILIFGLFRSAVNCIKFYLRRRTLLGFTISTGKLSQLARWRIRVLLRSGYVKRAVNSRFGLEYATSEITVESFYYRRFMLTSAPLLDLLYALLSLSPEGGNRILTAWQEVVL